ncbi:MAG: pro-sigmaK processing inhibitor BofA family protein [Acutalibacteraceae bacterium]|nr:pro-sigmaK processing inhibitor BofA family protein [Acutalibacteraceae bacterium]
MTVFDYIMVGCASLGVLIVLFFALRTRKFLKTLLSSAIIGIITLLILYFTSDLTGFSVMLTPYTLGTSCIFGLPGVVAIVICKMIFGV